MQGPATQGEFTVSYRNGCSIHNIARTTKAEACKVLAEWVQLCNYKLNHEQLQSHGKGKSVMYGCMGIPATKVSSSSKCQTDTKTMLPADRHKLNERGSTAGIIRCYCGVCAISFAWFYTFGRRNTKKRFHKTHIYIYILYKKPLSVQSFFAGPTAPNGHWTWIPMQALPHKVSEWCSPETWVKGTRGRLCSNTANTCSLIQYMRVYLYIMWMLFD